MDPHEPRRNAPPCDDNGTGTGVLRSRSDIYRGREGTRRLHVVGDIAEVDIDRKTLTQLP
jgi:hypothetical protein